MRLSLFFISNQNSNDATTRHEIERRAGLVSLFSQCWPRVWPRPVVALHELFASRERHLPDGNTKGKYVSEFLGGVHSGFSAVVIVPAVIERVHPSAKDFRNPLTAFQSSTTPWALFLISLLRPAC